MEFQHWLLTRKWVLEISIDLVWLYNKTLEMEPCLRLGEIVRLLENSVESQGQIEEKERGKTKEKRREKKWLGYGGGWWKVFDGFLPAVIDTLTPTGILFWKFRACLKLILFCFFPSCHPWSTVSGPALCLCLNNLLIKPSFSAEICVRFITLRLHWRDLHMLLVVEIVGDLNKWNEHMSDGWLMNICPWLGNGV